MKSSELLNLLNLGDFRICEGYFAELKHGLMGTFPALISENEEIFICTDKEMMEKAIRLLPKRRFTVNKMLLLINEKKNLAFCLSALFSQWDMSKESESLSIVTNEEFRKMKEGDLKWAPGLVSEDMSQKEFEETLRFAISQV